MRSASPSAGRASKVDIGYIRVAVGTRALGNGNTDFGATLAVLTVPRGKKPPLCHSFNANEAAAAANWVLAWAAAPWRERLEANLLWAPARRERFRGARTAHVVFVRRAYTSSASRFTRANR